MLGSFIRSFGVLNELAYKSETQVLEDYLEQQWRENEGELGPEPAGDGAIALMRLVVQAQIADKQKAMVSAFAALKEEDRQILCDEMARTGAEGQKYARTPQNHKVGGPAFLVYYSPAFVRALAPAEAVEALRLLAEVYRRARRLWPLNAKSEGQSVTVRIDQIKELSLPEIQAIYADGDSWLLSKRNNREAVVERHPLDDMAELMRSGVSVAVLKFWTRGQGARYTRGSQLGGLPSECSDSAWGSNDTPRSRVSSITPYAYPPGPAGAGGSRPSKSPLPNTPELASAPGSAEAVAIAGAPGEASQPQLSGREGPLEC